MSNFEKLAASPEVLGAFLESLTVINSSWEREFQKKFCAECKRPDCDGTPCIHKDKRDNPLLWLTQAAEREKQE